METQTETKRNPYLRHHVKKNLDIIILTLLVQQSLCGKDMMMEIYRNFDVMVSSGTLYPLLHSMERSGLIVSENGVKTRLYKLSDPLSTHKILRSHIEAKAQLTNFLKDSILG